MEKSNLNNLPPFYVGQKVKYNGKGTCPDLIYPDTKQVLTISGVYINDGYYFFIKGYEFTLNGNKQAFYYEHLDAIEEIRFPLISLSKVIEKEKQLVSAN